MAKAGFCSVCNENVVLTESGECSKAGHPSNCISGVYEAEGVATPAAAAAVASPAGQAPKEKKPLYKKWWVWVAGLLILGGLVSAMGGGGGNTDTAAEPSAPVAESPAAEPAAEPEAEPAAEPEAAPEAATAAKVGTALKVGDLVFKATDAKATKKLKSILGNKSGNWILVTASVKNESKEAVTIDSSFFKLIGKDGAEYETDSDGLMYVEGNENFFLAKINPNLSKKGKVLFAVAPGAKPEDFKLQVQTGLFGTETGEISLTR
ncbi:MAG: DUF4352 domain-containing protein [Coriobacteriia bacterium]|nr:DUF4352 domain-containing protein [Coriobacteriia bacterium]